MDSGRPRSLVLANCNRCSCLLFAHLSLLAPEPEAAEMWVGDEVVHWEEGRALLFDDTYVHSVSHRGRLPRYVLNVWFCHPCDENPAHSHGQSCIT